jgi:excisionase family DNA binding protein
MTTKEVAEYLSLHEITICKYAAQGKMPAVRIGGVWRFDKNAIDVWMGWDQRKTSAKRNRKRKCLYEAREVAASESGAPDLGSRGLSVS